jgi:hypothetical protein
MSRNKRPGWTLLSKYAVPLSTDRPPPRLALGLKLKPEQVSPAVVKKEKAQECKDSKEAPKENIQNRAIMLLNKHGIDEAFLRLEKSLARGCYFADEEEKEMEGSVKILAHIASRADVYGKDTAKKAADILLLKWSTSGESLIEQELSAIGISTSKSIKPPPFVESEAGIFVGILAGISTCFYGFYLLHKNPIENLKSMLLLPLWITLPLFAGIGVAWLVSSAATEIEKSRYSIQADKRISDSGIQNC